ncbi:helix-turn-helix transcriptional regulator [Streptomyces sp. SL13]|uniref:Helix-turn-helix transcriptional regulator n=1 Tax=Streptantibioticus silvisoli TaxID=2705255 RepID=A0AA90H5A4_9ACTN|nr:helix-turn-helix transcriptional regulator [Streptantibioticus silvisoli]MDI5971095.1 helix-turn-helix transcriptional regulator [Streptantibioticus silvisoli]
MSQARNELLGEFLRTRRALVEPSGENLSGGTRRRVPGMRREEIARAAAVSPDYYTRLEQGRQTTASTTVLDALAQALRLTTDERLHLYNLAGVAAVTDLGTAEQPLGDRIQRVVAMLGDTPAMVLGPLLDVAGGNRAWSFLFADFDAMPLGERNGLRWMLLAPEARRLYGSDWEEASAEMVGMLRRDAGRFPESSRLAELVGYLSEHSELFRRVWDEHYVSSWLHDRKTLHHPAFGSMDFLTDFIESPNALGQTVVAVTPVDAPAFQAAMRRWGAQG